jgi:crotonobetaine/carnitine-CoA ligase
MASTVGISSGRELRYVAGPDEPLTLSEILERRASATPDARFVTVGPRSLSFAAMAGRAEAAAAALAHVGIRRGDKVALMLPNCVEFLELWFGTAVLGAVLVPVNTGLRGEGLRHVIEHSEARLLVADGPLVEHCEEALREVAAVPLRVARGPAPGWEDLGDWLDGSYAPAGRQALAPGDLASILYTSGTTGRSKGVMNCHNAYAVAANEFCRAFVQARRDDVLYTSLPLFHVNAQMLSTVGALVSGLPLVLAERFSASGFIADLRRHGATVFNYIGAMLGMIYKQPARSDDKLNPARLAIGGAAPAEIWPAFEQRFGLSILEIYGLTETATFCAGNPPGDLRVGTIGRAVSWADVRIEREDGTEAPDGEPGEIVIRSRRPDILFQGYYKNVEATDGAMRGGWFHSGDRGRRDPGGHLVFLDRLKDVIRRRGENVSSYEVERILNCHPAVAESAVIGVPSDIGEEDVMAVIVPRAGAQLQPEELIEHCATRMAAFMVPRYIRLVEQLPKTATERVQKFRLRHMAVPEGVWDGQADRQGTTNNARVR